MFESGVLDIAIGMIFIFLIASFGVSAGNELLSSLLKWRARILEPCPMGFESERGARLLTRYGSATTLLLGNLARQR